MSPTSAIEKGEIAIDGPVVGLTFGEYIGIFCSGAMIDSRIVATAHHCVPEAGEVPNLLSKISIFVTSPGANLNDTKTERAKVIAIVSKKSGWSIGNCEKGFCEDLDDLLFLILDRDFKVPSNLKIATKEDIFRFRAQNSLVTTYGYGRTTYGGQLEKLPHKMTGILNEPNPGGYGAFTFNVNVSGVQNTCSGDSGGPSYVSSEGFLYYLGPTSGTRRPSCIEPPISDNGYYGGTAVAFKENLLEEARGIAYELKLKQEAEAKAKQEAEAKAAAEKVAAELKAKQEADAKAAAEKVAAELKAKQEAEAKAKQEAEAKAKQEAEAKAAAEKVAAELKAKQEAEAKAVASKKLLTITCIKGKFVKKVTAISPKCPTGYKKK